MDDQPRTSWWCHAKCSVKAKDTVSMARSILGLETYAQTIDAILSHPETGAQILAKVASLNIEELRADIS